MSGGTGDEVKVDAAAEATPVTGEAEAKGDEEGFAGRMPVMFISHGGGPCFFMPDEGMMKGLGKGSKAHSWFQRTGEQVLSWKPKAILIVSAHWEESPVRITRREGNSLLFDYYGFPDYTYDLVFDAPGSMSVADRASALLKKAGIEVNDETDRGLDHGVFVPLKAMWDVAPDIPVVQLSLDRSLDPAKHIEIGKALAPLRDEGVVIVGSGAATHNMRAPRGGSSPPGWATGFISWMKTTFTDSETDVEDRIAKACALDGADHFRDAHPREEHLIPIYVAFGAAGGEAATVMKGSDAYWGSFSLIGLQWQ